MSPINWGDAPTWLGTMFAAAAAGAAVWTLKSQRDQLDEQRVFIGEQSATLALERHELLAAARDRREAQARKIQLAAQDPEYVQVINGSDDPITEVHCVTRGMPAFHAIEVAPGEGVGTGILADLIRGTSEVHVERLGVGREAWFHVMTNERGTVHVSFTDAAGNKWIRDDAGGLQAAP
ncbi:hypothetical protein [Streptomyces sp. NBC_00996]|uniref:hypothetical protein n=1 Tax=Streptomyces sp. NBC_00996 TaxID=2903710 RepID=UPI0038634B2E|nr:hypothetical protein OG390_15440 [Streptomyces sp. NBC_00996]